MAKRSRIVRFLESPKLAVALLIYLGVFALLGTAVPVGGTSSPDFGQFAAKYATILPALSALGLTNPYSSPLFMVPALLLFVSTCFCAWRRTQVAMTRVRFERDLDAEAVARMTARSGEDVGDGDLDTVAEALRGAGFRRQRRDGDTLIASGSIYASLASPVFHWLLAALIIVTVAGRLTRSEGLMGVPVGHEKPNVAASYGAIQTGPLFGWSAQPDLIAVPKLEFGFVEGGIDRGVVPTVALKDAAGNTLKEQRVYPNHALTHGPVMIHSSEFGIAPQLALYGTDGGVIATTTPVIDFDENYPLGTKPNSFDLTNPEGKPSIAIEVAVVQRNDLGEVVERLAPKPKLSVVATDLASNSRIASETIEVGQQVLLPEGQSLGFESIDYYARLSVVNDWSVTPIYVLFFLGIVAVSVSLLMVPRIAVVSKDDDGTMHASVRFYRPAAQEPKDVYDSIRSASAGTDETTKEGDAHDA